MSKNVSYKERYQLGCLLLWCKANKVKVFWEGIFPILIAYRKHVENKDSQRPSTTTECIQAYGVKQHPKALKELTDMVVKSLSIIFDGKDHSHY